MVCTLFLCVEVAAGDIIKVCGQNLQNYYWNYAWTKRTSDNYLAVSNYSDDAGRAEKTHRMVNALLAIDADVYAFCEVEATEIILKQLADSLTKYGTATYSAVEDDITYTYTPDDKYDNHLKSGFIYRTDKVKPYGVNHATATVSYYVNVMRVQCFETLASQQRFVLSMNHFKSGGNSSDITSRVNNATWLLNNISSYLYDPDVLVMGDLNCEKGEEAFQVLEDAGYEDQVLRFNSNAYSHCFSNGSLLDHALANASMARQVTNAEVLHVCTTCFTDNEDIAYSDHDPYVVTLNLSSSSECENFNYSESFYSDLGLFQQVSVKGDPAWTINSYHYAQMTGYNDGENEDWLISPSFDFEGKGSATVQFTHCAGYGIQANWPSHLKLFISDDYQEDVSAAHWTELEIDHYGSANWEWKNVSIDIPQAYLGKKNVHVAFRYTIESSSDCPKWEIKNFNMIATCATTGLQERSSEMLTPQKARKVLEGGHPAILLPDGSRVGIDGKTL